MKAVEDTPGASNSARSPAVGSRCPAGVLLLLAALLAVATPLSAQIPTNPKARNLESDVARPGSHEPYAEDTVPARGAFESLYSPVLLVVGSAAEFAGLVTLSQPPLPIRALRDVRAWGLSPEIESVGPRSGLAVTLELERFAPLFLETGFSLAGSQRHSVGIALGDQQLGARLAYTFRRDAQDTFWGIGSGSLADQRSDFLRDKSEAQISGWVPLAEFAGLSGGVAYEDNRVGRGHDSALSDLQDISDFGSLFGVAERTRFLRFNLATTFDFTRQDGFQRRGIWLQLGSVVFRGVDGTDSDFHRFHGEFRGYLPVESRHMLALRGLIEHNELTGGVGIPFYDLSRMGGSRNGPRGFDGGRFRDRAGVSLMAEWRYEIWRAAGDQRRLQAFLLFDEGGVASSLFRLGSSDLRPSYGFGLRLQKRNGLATVGYVAFSEEGTQLGVRTQWPF